jgi:hypothetical protein
MNNLLQHRSVLLRVHTPSNPKRTNSVIYWLERDERIEQKAKQ